MEFPGQLFLRPLVDESLCNKININIVTIVNIEIKLTSTTAVHHQHLKVKNTVLDISLTKNYASLSAKTFSKKVLPTPKSFHQLFIFVNLYQIAKNHAISLISSGYRVDLKILQSDWRRVFWPIYQEQDFFHIQDLCMNTASNKNFHYRTNSVKINDQIFQQIEKTLVLANLSNFGGKKFFPKNPGLSHTNSYGFLATC